MGWRVSEGVREGCCAVLCKLWRPSVSRRFSEEDRRLVLGELPREWLLFRLQEASLLGSAWVLQLRGGEKGRGGCCLAAAP